MDARPAGGAEQFKMKNSKLTIPERSVRAILDLPPGTKIIGTLGGDPGLAVVIEPGKEPMTVREYDRLQAADRRGDDA